MELRPYNNGKDFACAVLFFAPFVVKNGLSLG